MDNSASSTVDEFLNAASITCGSVFAGYLGVRVGDKGAEVLYYPSLILIFVTAILFVAILSVMSKALVRRKYRAAGLGVAFYLFNILMLILSARNLPIDIGVLLCVIGSWSIVPIAATVWGWRGASGELSNG